MSLLSLLFTGAAPTVAQTAVAVVMDPEGVNLRGGPGTIFSSLGVAPKGTELPILGPKVNSNWIPVSYQGRLGFVFDEFVEVRVAMTTVVGAPGVAALPAAPGAAPVSSLPPAAVTPPSGQQVRVSVPEGINLRAGTGLDQGVLIVIPNGTRLTITGRSPDGAWAATSYAGLSGWVNTQYLLPVLPGEEQAVTTSAGGRYVWPVAGRSITTHFSPGHPGVDIDQFPAGGNPVVAVAAGKVVFAGGNACCSYGIHVKVEHRDGVITLYAHLQVTDVREGQEVTQGQVLGRSGNSGYSTGAHLHFELHINGGAVDPLAYLPR